MLGKLKAIGTYLMATITTRANARMATCTAVPSERVRWSVAFLMVLLLAATTVHPVSGSPGIVARAVEPTTFTSNGVAITTILSAVSATGGPVRPDPYSGESTTEQGSSSASTSDSRITPVGGPATSTSSSTGVTSTTDSISTTALTSSSSSSTSSTSSSVSSTATGGTNAVSPTPIHQSVTARLVAALLLPMTLPLLYSLL